MKISKARYHVFMSLASRLSDEARPFKKPSRYLEATKITTHPKISVRTESVEGCANDSFTDER